MMWKETYQRWLSQPSLDPDLKSDLEDKSASELEDRFYTNLEFGTGGMRGILGAGTNRLNIYTIRKANAGLAAYLTKHYSPKELMRGVVIAHDNRHMSHEFALESARVLGYYGIKSYLFDRLRPTPELSFATRYLGAISGIVITASHNPPNYNGYKIYDASGCQYTPQYADEIVGYVNAVEDVFQIPALSLEELESEGLIEYIGDDVDEHYLELVKSVQIHPEIDKNIKIVFTPLHGTSAMLGARLLSATGYEFYPVEEQMVHDPDFSTVASPNPENPNAFKMAIELGRKIDADLLIATDPDADRLGIAVKDGSEYRLLSGNQTGAILLYYLLNESQKLGLLPKRGVVFNTVVTSDLGAKIARSFGFEVISTLTGFKFIGEQIRLLEKTEKKFLFGYEESFGYLINPAVRDKDALQALLLAVEAQAFYKEREQKSLYDVLLDIYEKYGYHSEALISIDLVGVEGKSRIDRIMNHLHEQHYASIAGVKVKSIEDYLQRKRFFGGYEEVIELPKSDVVKYILEDGSWFVFRPSGTEPKLKIYLAARAADEETANKRIEILKEQANKIVSTIE
ncbi:MAG: phospho-sugar mutase [Bacilli bacterium]|nr:phospho-sugar mutase [Bacilli bacterium]MBN2696245.1 phospho-sugar mutase [Bacilli bacterium]